VGGIPVLAHTLLAYQRCPAIREIVVVTRPCDFEAVKQIREQYGITKLKHMTSGGATRQESAKKGLSKLTDDRIFLQSSGYKMLITSFGIGLMQEFEALRYISLIPSLVLSRISSYRPDEGRPSGLLFDKRSRSRFRSSGYRNRRA
jgi:hypothetical protein